MAQVGASSGNGDSGVQILCGDQEKSADRFLRANCFDGGVQTFQQQFIVFEFFSQQKVAGRALALRPIAILGHALTFEHGVRTLRTVDLAQEEDESRAGC